VLLVRALMPPSYFPASRGSILDHVVELDTHRAVLRRNLRFRDRDGRVTSVDQRGAVIDLGAEVEGYLRVSEFSRERIEDLTQHLKVGQVIETMIVNVDRKTRSINLSIKAKDQVEQSQAMQKLASDSSANSGTTNLGALLKAKLNQQQ
jgi:transcriptional accessory protein Tex/SPT6